MIPIPPHIHTILITGSTKTHRAALLSSHAAELLGDQKNTAQVDYLELNAEEKASIGIPEVRHAIQWAQTKPLGNTRVVAIRHAHRLTIEAQNALLKLLEEPPSHTRIILESSTPFLLLPTIHSRSYTVHLPLTMEDLNEAEVADAEKSLQLLLSTPLKDRLEWAAEFLKKDKNPERVAEFIGWWEVLCAREIQKERRGARIEEYATTASLCNTTRLELLTTSADVTAALELLLLSLPLRTT